MTLAFVLLAIFSAWFAWRHTARACPSRRRTVLIADDDRGCQHYGLDGSGWDTERAYSGAEAMERVRSNGFDALALDLRFQGQPMQGRDIYERVRAERPDLPIVIVTAYAGDLDMLPDGVHAIIEKPCRDGALASALFQALAAKEA